MTNINVLRSIFVLYKNDKIMKTRINKAYNEFRNNITPVMFNKVSTGSMTHEAFENWFDQREETFFALMSKYNA